jgi:hypothetical protein
MFIMILLWRFRVVQRGVLGLGLIMVHVYYDFPLQGRWCRVVPRGVLSLGLIMVHFY